MKPSTSDQISSASASSKDAKMAEMAPPFEFDNSTDLTDGIYTSVDYDFEFTGGTGKAKLEFGLAKGKKLYDKREDIAKKDLRRETERDFKIKNL